MAPECSDGVPGMVQLSSTHRRQLEWFHSHAGSLVSWPQPLPDGSFLASRAKGIYKPKGVHYAVSVHHTLNSPYPDRDPISAANGGWIYLYHQETRHQWTNKALMYCRQNGLPVGIMRQVQRRPSLYRVLGVAYVTDWNDEWFRFESLSQAPSPEERSAFILPEADKRDFRAVTVAQRKGQEAFRRELLALYGCCQVTGTPVAETLQAAHIYPDRGMETYHVSNGLLLRADIHLLFDAGLVVVDPKRLLVLLAPQLRTGTYSGYHRVPLRLGAYAAGPSREALRWHLSEAAWDVAAEI